MSPLDKEVLAEKRAAVERHLNRVQERLPTKASQLLACLFGDFARPVVDS
jgi:hypothetical protein